MTSQPSHQKVLEYLLIQIGTASTHKSFCNLVPRPERGLGTRLVIPQIEQVAEKRYLAHIPQCETLSNKMECD